MTLAREAKSPARKAPADDITDIRTNERWFSVYFKTLGAQGIVDAIERNTEARLRDQEDRVLHRRWVAESCTPNDPNETATVTRDGRRLRCRIDANVAYGLAPRLVSIATLDIPQ